MSSADPPPRDSDAESIGFDRGGGSTDNRNTATTGTSNGGPVHPSANVIPTSLNAGDGTGVNGGTPLYPIEPGSDSEDGNNQGNTEPPPPLDSDDDSAIWPAGASEGGSNQGDADSPPPLSSSAESTASDGDFNPAAWAAVHGPNINQRSVIGSLSSTGV